MGDSIDVHCGGIDSKFPHYENEIAQSQGSSGKIVCNFVGFVNIEGDECRKVSVGDFQTLGNACPTAMEVRAYQYLVVTLQYRAVVPTQLQNFEAALKDDFEHASSSRKSVCSCQGCQRRIQTSG
jgi:cysteinyl-tRNA synthetase